jgi:hypothetical protein
MTENLRREQIKDLKEKDELVKYLLAMLKAAGVTGEPNKQIMTELVPYITRRDHVVFNHAYQAGRASA